MPAQPLVSDDMSAEPPIVTDDRLPPGALAAVVVNDDGQALALLTVDGRRPAIEVAPDQSIASLLNQPLIVEQLAAGLPALVVTVDGRPTGLLPADAFLEYLERDYLPTTGPMGDESLHGRTVLPPVVVVCACGHRNRNEYQLVEVGVTRCAAGHVLQLDWA